MSTSSVETTRLVPAETLEVEEKILRFLETNQFFSHLPKAARKTAASSLQARVVHAEEDIVERLSQSESVFLVVSGRVCLVKESGDSSIRMVTKNGTFGEAGFYFRTRRTFTAVAKEETVLMVLTRPVYEANRKAPWLKSFASFIELSARQLVCSQLQKVEMIRDMQLDTLQALSKVFTVSVIARGETVFREGDPGDTGYFVLASGELVVTLNSSKGLETIEVKRLTAGATFGEISLLESKPRTATITSMVDSTLFRLSKGNFEKFLADNPDVQKIMQARIRERSDMKSLTEGIPFVRSLKPNKVHLLASVCVPHFYKAGRSILTEGSRHPNMFFILARGSVDVLIGKARIKTLDERGQYFGELSIVSNRAHSATIRAGKDGAHCLACSKAEFESIFADEAAVFAEVALKVLGKDCELSNILNHPSGRDSFVRHCETEYAAENVAFFVAADEFERMGTHQVRRDVLEALGQNVDDVVQKRTLELREKAQAIYDRFIDSDGPEPVNIRSSTRDTITARMRDGEWSYELFSEAKAAVYTLLERDNFARYQKSKVFEDMLAELGVYDDSKHRSLARDVSHISRKHSVNAATLGRRAAQDRHEDNRIREQILE